MKEERGRVAWGMTRAVLGVWVLGVNWEVVRWFVARLGDGGDEPWGMAALLAAVLLTPRAAWRARMVNTACLAAAGLALAAVLGGGFLPMLVRAGLVAAALGGVIGIGWGRGAAGGGAGRLGLLGLSLPVMATAQFYAGYPLRVITAELGRPLLALAGVATERSGVVLSWAGGEVIVDAPCSGVRMLWAGAVLACGLAAWRQLNAGRAAIFVAVALSGVLIANAVRAAAVFLTESGVWANAGWVHETVGAVLFGGVAVGMWIWAGREVGRGVETEGNLKVAKIAERITGVGFGGWGWIGVVVGFGVVGWSLVRAEGGVGRAAVMESEREAVVWPEVFEGELLRPVGGVERLGAWAGGFAGETRVFEQRARVVVMRRLRAASRTVHPAADCFRARGYAVKADRLVKDEAGGRWSEFVAERAGETWRVRERWRDERGNVWTDVSAWWWAAQGAEAHGPWWAETVAVRE